MAHVMVVYYSGSGNTKRMAELVAEGVGEVGSHEVEVVAVEELKLDEFIAADACAIGSPDYFTYVAGQIKTLFDDLLARKSELEGKPCVGFISHGGGGGALDSLETLSKSVGLRKVADGVKCKGAPEGTSAEACRQIGAALAKALG